MFRKTKMSHNVITNEPLRMWVSERALPQKAFQSAWLFDKWLHALNSIDHLVHWAQTLRPENWCDVFSNKIVAKLGVNQDYG
jgi:hypothetical protein